MHEQPSWCTHLYWFDNDERRDARQRAARFFDRALSPPACFNAVLSAVLRPAWRRSDHPRERRTVRRTFGCSLRNAPTRSIRVIAFCSSGIGTERDGCHFPCTKLCRTAVDGALGAPGIFHRPCSSPRKGRTSWRRESRGWPRSRGCVRFWRAPRRDAARRKAEIRVCETWTPAREAAAEPAVRAAPAREAACWSTPALHRAKAAAASNAAKPEVNTAG